MLQCDTPVMSDAVEQRHSSSENTATIGTRKLTDAPWIIGSLYNAIARCTAFI